jgi:phosphohistidine swiveling domain-containing protein
MVDPEGRKEGRAAGQGPPAGPGGGVGQIVFTADDAESWAKQGKKVILVRNETSPEDVHGMHAAQGILTAKGGMTSHAALVARGWGKCCIVGCGSPPDRRQGQEGHRRRQGPGRGRLDLHERQHRRGLCKARWTCFPRSPIEPLVQEDHGLGRPVPARSTSAPTADTPADAAQADGLRRRRYRPLPAPSTCSSSRERIMGTCAR